MNVTKSTGITIDQALVERCDRLRLAGPCKYYSLKRFREMILDIGMNKYERIILPVAKGESPVLAQPETRLQAAGYETTPETPPMKNWKSITGNIRPGRSPAVRSKYGDREDDLMGGCPKLPVMRRARQFQ
jgi:hypothetical protein